MTPKISAVVPTLGHSPWLEPCLEALRREGGEDLELLLVAQGAEIDRSLLSLADRVVSLPANAGFAAANNRAFAAARGELLATVNDDAVVEEGWLAALVATLAAEPRAAAVQGVNRSLDDPRRVDGCGLAWNRFWQAVQLGRGEPVPAADRPTEEIFGVSATAALYRRAALAAVGGRSLAAFDERLFAYYEDVDLAVRLRAAGYRALLVPAARARHAGSLTGRRLGSRRRLIYGNRHLVLARLFGRGLGLRWPWILLRDLIDLGKALVRRDLGAGREIAAGLARAAVRSPGFVHLGKPLLAPGSLRRFQTLKTPPNDASPEPVSPAPGLPTCRRRTP